MSLVVVGVVVVDMMSNCCWVRGVVGAPTKAFCRFIYFFLIKKKMVVYFFLPPKTTSSEVVLRRFCFSLL